MEKEILVLDGYVSEDLYEFALYESVENSHFYIVYYYESEVYSVFDNRIEFTCLDMWEDQLLTEFKTPNEAICFAKSQNELNPFKLEDKFYWEELLK
jgi:hypothetical protein